MKVCFLDHSSVWENCGMKEEITGTAQEITLLFYFFLIFDMHFNSENSFKIEKHELCCKLLIVDGTDFGVFIE